MPRKTAFLNTVSPVDLLRRLVATDSRSPGALAMPVAPDTITEETLCALIEEWLGELGFACERQYPAARRPQLLARHCPHPDAAPPSPSPPILTPWGLTA